MQNLILAFKVVILKIQVATLNAIAKLFRI